LTGFQKAQPLHKLPVYQRNAAWFRYWLANDIDRTSVGAARWPGWGVSRDDVCQIVGWSIKRACHRAARRSDDRSFAASVAVP